MKTTTKAIHKDKMYLRLLYHEFFWEFDTIEEIKAFVRKMDEEEPMWDYDCFTIHKGDPRWETDKNFGCFDFETLYKVRKEIEKYRKTYSK
jgi:hypothetical protein